MITFRSYRPIKSMFGSSDNKFSNKMFKIYQEKLNKNCPPVFNNQNIKSRTMKNILKKSIQNLTLKVVMISTVAFFAVSCEKETMTPENSDSLNKGKVDGVNSLASGIQSIAEIAINSGEFNELLAALSYVDVELDAGLVNLFLNGTDNYTVFAPGDNAFFELYRDLGIDGITDLPANLVLDVLLYHVAEGLRASNSVVPTDGTRTIETLLGKTFTVSSMGRVNDIMGNTVTIIKADILASNGIIHVIDVVMHPFGREELSEGGTNMGSDADNTVVAPSTASIAEIAISAGFSELVEALSYVDQELGSGLVNLLQNGTDQYTVFAPTNEAFDALYDALEINNITDLPATLVSEVLLYHVAEGRQASKSVVPFTGERTIETLLGVAFSVNTEGLITATGNTANIVATDFSASNGIIHVIDSVILPIE